MKMARQSSKRMSLILFLNIVFTKIIAENTLSTLALPQIEAIPILEAHMIEAIPILEAHKSYHIRRTK